jgi:hypothetical protein
MVATMPSYNANAGRQGISQEKNRIDWNIRSIVFFEYRERLRTSSDRKVRSNVILGLETERTGCRPFGLIQWTPITSLRRSRLQIHPKCAG